MRYAASDKLEIIRIVEQSHLPAKRTLDQIGIGRRTFYRWYDRYLEGGPEALEDRPSAPNRVWNRIAPEVQDQIVEMALEQSELSPRELAVRFTDERQYFVSEATVYRLLTRIIHPVEFGAPSFEHLAVSVDEGLQVDGYRFDLACLPRRSGDEVSIGVQTGPTIGVQKGTTLRL
eukprot:gene21051-21818_t